MCSRSLQLRLKFPNEHFTPILPTRMRIRMKQKLICSFRILLPCPRDSALQAHMVRSERIIVQGENWSNNSWTAFSFPDNKIVFGTENVVFSCYIDAFLVFLLSSNSGGAGFIGQRVELVIARTPPYGIEAFRRSGECRSQLLSRVSNVSAENESISWMRC